MTETVRIELDGRRAQAPRGATLIAVARETGIDIPALCERPGLEAAISCMLCVVEDLERGRLVPACSTQVEDGMRIATRGAAVDSARKTALDLLLSDHVGDCEGPCRLACPAGMDIPAMLHALATDRLDEAARIARRHIALPAALGRICPAPCEKACRRGRIDAPVGICLLKRHAADHSDAGLGCAVEPQTGPAATGAVAVVGAGPAGLSAAFALKRYGYRVTVFEKSDTAGGGLRAPGLRDRLPSAVLDAEIAALARLGLDMRYRVEVGRDLGLDALKRQFDAVVLAVGAEFSFLASAPGIETGPRGIEADRATRQTGDPRVFACGGAAGAAPMAVRAGAQGFAAARSVDLLLRGGAVAAPRRRYNHHIAERLDADEEQLLMEDASTAPRLAPSGGESVGYSAEEARAEAARCMRCACRKSDTCRLRAVAETCGADPKDWKPPSRRRIGILRDGGLRYEPAKCIACGLCVRLSAKAGEPLGLAFIGRGFDMRVGVPFGEGLRAGLATAAAVCVEACPTGALSMELGA